MAKSKRRQEILTLVVVFVGVVVVSALVVYFMGGARRGAPDANRQPNDAVLSVPDQRATTSTQNPGDETFIDRLFGNEHNTATNVTGATWAETMGRLSLRLVLAALLGAALAFRPRKRILALKRNPYVSQTQILLAIVAA